MPQDHALAPRVGAALFLLIFILLIAPFSRAIDSPLQGDGTPILRTSQGTDYSVQLRGGTYYLGVASDGSTGVNATVTNSSRVVADKAANSWGAQRVTLPTGNYSVHLVGVGSAVLARDFQNPGSATIQVDDRASLFLLPQGRSEIHVSITMSSGAPTRVDVYDAFMQPRYGANFTNGITFIASLPQDASDAAYLVVVPQGGNTNMTMSWQSTPPSAPLNTVLVVGVLVGVPLVIVAVVVYVTNRRRRGGAGRSRPPRGGERK